MKVIILAAGEGRRLRPLTDDRPKAMLEAGGRSLFDRALTNLRSAGFSDSDIIVLSGHAAVKLHKAAPACRFIHNELYASTNNIYSLWLARKELAGEGFVLLNSDVLFHQRLASKIMKNDHRSVLMVDDINPLVEEEMRVQVDGHNRITAIAKTLDANDSSGEYIGLARFDADFSKALFARINQMVQSGHTDVWYENAIAEILDGFPLYALSTEGLPWIEIDTHQDLARAIRVAEKIKDLEG